MDTFQVHHRRCGLIALCDQPLSKVIEPFSLSILPFTTQIVSCAAAFKSLLSRVKIGFDATTSEKPSIHFLAFNVKKLGLEFKMNHEPGRKLAR